VTGKIGLPAQHELAQSKPAEKKTQQAYLETGPRYEKSARGYWLILSTCSREAHSWSS